MVLRSELKGFDAEYKTGDKIGIVKDVVVDTTKEKWPVLGLVVSPGVLKKNVMVAPTEQVRIDVDEERVMVPGETKLEEALVGGSSRRMLQLGFMHKTPVYTKDEIKIGKIYDAVITTRLVPWKVWKVLIKVPELISRRLRLDIRDIEKIADDRITLKLTRDELEETTEED